MNELAKQIEDYLHYCTHQKKLNSKTIKAYGIDLSQFQSYSKSFEVPLGKSSIMAYIEILHSQYKPKTAKRKIASLRAFINYLEFEEIVEKNLLDKIRLEFKEPKVLPRALSLKTIPKLFLAVYAVDRETCTEYQKRMATRDAAVLELLFATGLRVSELCNVQATEIDLKTGWVKVQGKGAKERIVFISNATVLGTLKNYRRAFQKEINTNGHFFVNRFGQRLSEQSVREMIKKYAHSAKIHEHITPHMLRHSFATLMLEEDVDIRYIQSILGHSSITTTQIYTHVALAKQRKIMNKKHPRNKMAI